MRPCIPGLCIRAIGSLLCVPKYIVVCSSPSKCELRGFRTYAALLNNKNNERMCSDWLWVSFLESLLVCLKACLVPFGYVFRRVALDSLSFGANSLRNLAKNKQNRTKGAPGQVNIGPRGYPLEALVFFRCFLGQLAYANEIKQNRI